MNPKLSRRALLAGLGAGLTLSSAGLLGPKLLRAADARPARFVVFFVPHGWPIEQVNRFQSGSRWLDDNLILGGFSKWQDQVTVLRGVSNRVSAAHGGIHSVLTGTGGRADSIDYTVAQALGTRSWVLGTAMRDGGDDYPYFSRITNHQGSAGTPIFHPLDFVDQMFTGNSDLAAQELEKSFRSELLNMNECQLERLKTELSGISHEENRVSSHIAAVQELKARNDAPPPDADACGTGDVLQQLQSIRNLNPHEIKNTKAILEGHVAALGPALVCGASRVAVVQSHGSGGQYTAEFPGGPEGVTGNAHMNSHAGGPAERRIREYGRTLRWYLDRLSTLMETLDTPDPLDPEHTVLENTTILYTSEMCDGSHVSEAKEITINGQKEKTFFPMVLLGGCAGKVKTGGVIETPVDHVDVLQTLARAHATETAHGNVLNHVLA